MTDRASPIAIRLAVEWLAANASGVSLVDWEPRSQTLLNAADEIDLMRGLLAEAIEALQGWDDDPVDGEPWIVRANAALGIADDREPPEPDGECFRGGEAASALAEEQGRIQRTLK